MFVLLTLRTLGWEERWILNWPIKLENGIYTKEVGMLMQGKDIPVIIKDASVVA